MYSKLLTLRALDDSVFEAPPAPDKVERMFGGQLMAQSARAAQLTLPDDRPINSIHAHFLRPGDVNEPLTLEVDAVRDGRSFSTRVVTAIQHAKAVFRITVSFQVADQSPPYAKVRMPEVPPPDAVTYTYRQFTLDQTGEDYWPGSERPIDIRYINPPAPRGTPVTDDQLMWMRIEDELVDDPALHQTGLLYLSDSTVVDHLMLPLGKRWQDADFDGTSLDHAMWFHEPARADDWLLFVQTPEVTGGGRGLASGRFFNRHGQLVATCVQEGLMRWRD